MHDKGSRIRVLLADAAIVIHDHLCELSIFHNNSLLARKRQHIRGLWMQDIFPRLERNHEPAVFICLDLHDSFSLWAVYCYDSLIRLIRTFLSHLYHRAYRTNENLPLDPAINWFRRNCRTCRYKKKDGYKSYS